MALRILLDNSAEKLLFSTYMYCWESYKNIVLSDDNTLQSRTEGRTGGLQGTTCFENRFPAM